MPQVEHECIKFSMVWCNHLSLLSQLKQDTIKGYKKSMLNKSRTSATTWKVHTSVQWAGSPILYSMAFYKRGWEEPITTKAIGVYVVREDKLGLPEGSPS